ncbi:MAG: (Fe-S)-binding protein [Firmicutes bacterium]|nr:(Fe-S)-binding protein [Bacillota bacterium]
MRVSLFVTCLCDLLQPQVAESTVRLLWRLGVDVEVPPAQTCCGQPGYNAGHRADARAVARAWIRAFEAAGDGPIVAPSGSCAAMVRHEYPRLFAGEPAWAARAAALAERTYELCEFIVHVLGRPSIGGRLEAVAAYHPSCHLTRSLGLSEEPLSLLRGVEGLRLLELPHAGECCGFGGLFAVTQAAISTAMADAKIRDVEASGAPILVAGDTGCLLQIGGRLRRLGKPVRVMHIAELLDAATGGSGAATGGSGAATRGSRPAARGHGGGDRLA